jgi:hypothetical protein
VPAGLGAYRTSYFLGNYRARMKYCSYFEIFNLY